jgi:hypothetical protein
MTDKEIEEGLAVCEAAHPGPWTAETHAGESCVRAPAVGWEGMVYVMIETGAAEAKFAAAARTGWPKTLLALQQARQEIERLHGNVDEAIRMIDASRSKP